jgi:hypothetical protein
MGIENAHSLLMANVDEHYAFDDRGGVLDRGGGVYDRFPQAKPARHVKGDDLSSPKRAAY